MPFQPCRVGWIPLSHTWMNLSALQNQIQNLHFMSLASDVVLRDLVMMKSHHYFKEDIIKMESMNIDEQIDYAIKLREEGKYVVDYEEVEAVRQRQGCTDGA